MQNEATDIAPLLTAEGSRLLEAVGPYDADDARTNPWGGSSE